MRARAHDLPKFLPWRPENRDELDAEIGHVPSRLFSSLLIAPIQTHQARDHRRFRHLSTVSLGYDRAQNSLLDSTGTLMLRPRGIDDKLAT